MDGGCSKNHNVSSEERKLELRLAPPGEENWSKERDSSLPPLGHFSPTMNNNGNKAPSFSSFENHPVGAVLSSPWAHTRQHNQTKAPSFLQFPSNESSQSCKVADLQNAEQKAFLPSANTAVTNKRTAPAPAPVVGWPPVRLFRRNLASSSSSKPAAESPNAPPRKDSSEILQIEASNKGLFVKINMDGVPIGRKVDLKVYDSYEKLSTAVDELFRGLLAAQNDSSSAGGIVNKREGEKATKGILDGSGEYTLVYEDNEGDRMLVGDVPWHMFVSTVKRLRVLKSSELPALSLGNGKQSKTSA